MNDQDGSSLAGSADRGMNSGAYMQRCLVTRISHAVSVRLTKNPTGFWFG